MIIPFTDDFNIFAFAKSRIIKQIKGELAAVFDIKLLAFYVSLKITCDCKQKTIKLS